MDYSKIRREYLHQPLEMSSMDPDPMQMFRVWFDEAFTFFKSETNAMSLATSDQNGQPSVRTVLLKGVTEHGFIFYTNYLSRKGRELTENPVAAILFYWPGLDRQIRIEGPVSKIPDEQSETYFRSRPPGSQISAAASPQSHPITLEELHKRRSAAEQSESIVRPDQWGGYELQGKYFEFWSGRENRFHDRVVYQMTPSGEFERYRIAP